MLKSFIIGNFAKWLVGGELFSSAKEIVGLLNNEDLTGTEKKEKAINSLKSVFSKLGTFMLNIAIELAVVWAKSKS